MPICPHCQGTGWVDDDASPDVSSGDEVVADDAAATCPAAVPQPVMRHIASGTAFEDWLVGRLQHFVVSLGLSGTVTNSSSAARSGDIMYRSARGTLLIIDAKEHTEAVPASQYRKVLRDMSEHGAAWGALITRSAAASTGSGKPVRSGVEMTSDRVVVIADVAGHAERADRALIMLLLLVENEGVTGAFDISYETRLFFELCPLIGSIASDLNKVAKRLDELWSTVQKKVIKGKKIKPIGIPLACIEAPPQKRQKLMSSFVTEKKK